MKGLVILLLCVTFCIADERSDCRELCSRINVMCALPSCGYGYEFTQETCVPDTYSCCPTCIKTEGVTTVLPEEDLNRTECLQICPLVRCAWPVCGEGYKVDARQCVPDSYSCCPRCVEDTDMVTVTDTKREECLKQCPLVLCALPICEEGYKIDSEACVPDS
ncbi:hypothetical protein L9F63_023565, partial [Diploptera punctata]